MRHLFATTAIAAILGVAAPAVAQKAPDQSQPQSQSQTQNQPQSQSGDAPNIVRTERSIPGQPALGQDIDEIKGGGIALVPSQDITSRELKTADSQTGGQIAYVVVESDSGQIAYLLTPVTGQGDAGMPPERFRVLPWEAIKRDASGGMRADVDQNQLSQMPQVASNDLGKLQSPEFRQEVDKSWQQSQQDQQGQGQGQGQDRQTAEVSLPPGHPPMLLVGPDKTEMLGPDGLPAAAVIVDDQGAHIADLDHVVVDTAHGLVAYTIISEAGPAEKLAFRASPLSSLKWDAEKQAFVAPPSLKNSPAHASAEDAEKSVGNEGQLSELYEGSGVPPYWQGQGTPENPAGATQPQGEGTNQRQQQD